MPVQNRIADFGPEMTEWRRYLHRHPELGFECLETAEFVAGKLREFGVDEMETGIAKTGLVALIHGKKPGPVIGLRADMDALPMAEETGVDHASQVAGRMHACGHDGHTTMLLGAAKYLAETRNFAGTVALIFQPAEENGGGGGVMVEEGVLDRFGIEAVYALHNAPNLAEGSFHTKSGPMMAAVDTFEVHIQGRGGHAAKPHETADPIIAAASMVQAIQTISSRSVDPLDDLVVAVTQVHSGSADNVTPDTAYICGTVRSFRKPVQEMVVRRLEEVVSGQAASFGIEARLDYDFGYPAMENHAKETGFAADVAREVAGTAQVVDDCPPEMGAEDFSYLLEKRPGAYLYLGAGPGPGLHHPKYDFNDAIAPIGASFFARLVERALPA